MFGNLFRKTPYKIPNETVDTHKLLRLVASGLIAHNMDVAHLFNALTKEDVDITKDDLEEIVATFNKASYEAGAIILAIYAEVAANGGPSFNDEVPVHFAKDAHKMLTKYKGTLIKHGGFDELRAFTHLIDDMSTGKTLIPEHLEKLAQRLFIGAHKNGDEKTH